MIPLYMMFYMDQFFSTEGIISRGFHLSTKELLSSTRPSVGNVTKS